MQTSMTFLIRFRDN